MPAAAAAAFAPSLTRPPKAAVPGLAFFSSCSSAAPSAASGMGSSTQSARGSPSGPHTSNPFSPR